MLCGTRRAITALDHLRLTLRLPQTSQVFPWVIDMTVPPEVDADTTETDDGNPPPGWRDLSKTKWRLTKGDEQLDFTFSRSDPPHHIPDDPVSELAVCMYKARVLPQSLLQRCVRAVFEPNEYPSNLERLYAWTPDEAVPEFYCDAGVFRSRHERMPDLQPPKWAEGAEDFVRRHRMALESPRVSSALHLWLDVTFGHALVGEAALAAKNVPLPPDPRAVRSSGRLPLFSGPHPPRIVRPSRLAPFHGAGNGPQEGGDLLLQQGSETPQRLLRALSVPSSGDVQSAGAAAAAAAGGVSMPETPAPPERLSQGSGPSEQVNAQLQQQSGAPVTPPQLLTWMQRSSGDAPASPAPIPAPSTPAKPASPSAASASAPATPRSPPTPGTAAWSALGLPTLSALGAAPTLSAFWAARSSYSPLLTTPAWVQAVAQRGPGAVAGLGGLGAGYYGAPGGGAGPSSLASAMMPLWPHWVDLDAEASRGGGRSSGADGRAHRIRCAPADFLSERCRSLSDRLSKTDVFFLRLRPGLRSTVSLPGLPAAARPCRTCLQPLQRACRAPPESPTAFRSSRRPPGCSQRCSTRSRAARRSTRRRIGTQRGLRGPRERRRQKGPSTAITTRATARERWPRCIGSSRGSASASASALSVSTGSGARVRGRPRRRAVQ